MSALQQFMPNLLPQVLRVLQRSARCECLLCRHKSIVSQSAGLHTLQLITDHPKVSRNGHVIVTDSALQQGVVDAVATVCAITGRLAWGLEVLAEVKVKTLGIAFTHSALAHTKHTFIHSPVSSLGCSF